MGRHAAFYDFEQLLASARATWKPGERATTALLVERLTRPEILLLDDVAKRATPEGVELLGLVVNARINHPLPRPTILTTNALLDTTPGREEFNMAADARVLARFDDLRMGADRWARGNNLRAGQAGRLA